MIAGDLSLHGILIKWRDKHSLSLYVSGRANFFHHFPSQRLCPYGKIKEATPDCVMLEKATPINREYITRTGMALGEMEDTVSSNTGALRNMLMNTDSKY